CGNAKALAAPSASSTRRLRSSGVATGIMPTARRPLPVRMRSKATATPAVQALWPSTTQETCEASQCALLDEPLLLREIIMAGPRVRGPHGTPDNCRLLVQSGCRRRWQRSGRPKSGAWRSCLTDQDQSARARKDVLWLETIDLPDGMAEVRRVGIARFQ